jgi:hypothetical protein
MPDAPESGTPPGASGSSSGSSGSSSRSSGSSSSEDALRRLEQRLDQASAKAERLFAEAAAHAAGVVGSGATGSGATGSGAADSGATGSGATGSGAADSGATGSGRTGPGATGDSGKVPPAGWQTPGEAPSEAHSDLDLLMQLIQSVRDLIPPDLQHRLAAAVRELLLALRALIDWYLERMDHRRQESVQIQDIPIL